MSEKQITFLPFLQWAFLAGLWKKGKKKNKEIQRLFYLLPSFLKASGVETHKIHSSFPLIIIYHRVLGKNTIIAIRSKPTKRYPKMYAKMSCSKQRLETELFNLFHNEVTSLMCITTLRRHLVPELGQISQGTVLHNHTGSPVHTLATSVFIVTL